MSYKVINIFYKIKTGGGGENVAPFFVEWVTASRAAFQRLGSHATLLARL